MSFTAAFLTAQSRTMLVEWWEATFPDKPLLSRKYAEHMTIKFQPNHIDMDSTPMGTIVTIEVIGYAADTQGQAVVVRCRRVYSSNEIPHITVATNRRAPVYSNELLKREWTPIDGGPQLFGIVNRGQGGHMSYAHVSYAPASALRLVAAIDAELPYPDTSLTTLYSSSATQLHASDELLHQFDVLRGVDDNFLHTERTSPSISIHQLEFFANMRLEELTAELLKVLKTLPPSDISIDFAHTSWPLHRYVLGSYSSFLAKSIYGTTEAPNVVNSLHISDISPTLCKGDDVSVGGGGMSAAAADERDDGSSDDNAKSTNESEEKVSEESALMIFLLFYKHELAAEGRRLYEQCSISIKKLLTLLHYAMKWDIQNLVTALIEMLTRKMELMETIAELLEFEQRIKKMELPSDLEIKVSKTVWRFVWKLIRSARITHLSNESNQPINDDSLSLPLDNPIMFEGVQHVADLAAIEEDSSSSPEKSLFELEKKLISHFFEKMAIEEDVQDLTIMMENKRLEKERQKNKSSDADKALPKAGDILFAINGIKLESMVDDVHELSEKAVEMVETLGRPIKITFRDPSLKAQADGGVYDVTLEEEKLDFAISTSIDGLSVIVSKLTDLDDDTKCAICLETMTGSDTLITLTCDHVFHRDCISKSTNHGQPPLYHQSNSASSRSFKCPLCRCQVKMPLGGLLSRSVLSSNRCQTEGCSFMKHSLPLPSHFTASGGNYCCDYCRTSGHGHGTHCERIVDLPREEEEEGEEEEEDQAKEDTNASPSSAAAAEEPTETIRPSASSALAKEEDDVNTVAYWVKLFSKALKEREDKKRAKLKIESYGISNLDDSFMRRLTACLLQNIVSNRHAAEAIALLCQNDFALLFKYIQLCNREELVQIISMSDVFGLGVEHYQKALLLSKANDTPAASSNHRRPGRARALW